MVKKNFPVLNMHCAGCANNVERTVRKLPGVIEASVNFATNTLTVSYESDKLAPGEIRAAAPTPKLSITNTTNRAITPPESFQDCHNDRRFLVRHGEYRTPAPHRYG